MVVGSLAFVVHHVQTVCSQAIGYVPSRTVSCQLSGACLSHRSGASSFLASDSEGSEPWGLLMVLQQLQLELQQRLSQCGTFNVVAVIAVFRGPMWLQQNFWGVQIHLMQQHAHSANLLAVCYDLLTHRAQVHNRCVHILYVFQQTSAWRLAEGYLRWKVVCCGSPQHALGIGDLSGITVVHVARGVAVDNPFCCLPYQLAGTGLQAQLVLVCM
jgi:hypothetical protein